MRFETALLGVGATAYVLAAWAVAPGFYDSGVPLYPYNFTCPPPQAGSTSKPSSGHVDIKVINGVSDANAATTDDGQVVMGFLPGAFDSGSASPIRVNIVPTKTCPQPKGLRFVTNVYQVTASAQLVKDANITMLYSSLEPDPSAIYFATTPDGPCTSLGVQPQAQPWTIWTKTRQFGFFAAGYPPSKGSGLTIGGQALPVIVAVLIVIVVLAGLPRAVARRRGKNAR